MKPITSILIFIFTLTCIFSCSEQATAPVEKTAPPLGKLTFSINMTTAPSDVVKMRGMLYREETDTLFFAFEMQDDHAVALVEEIAAGNWYLRVDALNADEVVIYTGRSLVTVYSGQTTTVNLHLHPTTGSIEIIVTWGEEQDFALDFDGLNDMVLVPDNEKLHMTASMTLEAWIFPRDVSTNPGGDARMIIRKGNVYNRINYSLAIDIYKGPGVLTFGAGTGVSSTENALKINQWQHVAGVCNPRTGLISLYINGRLAGQESIVASPQPSTDPLTLGLTLRGDNLGIEDFFQGKMYDVRIWNIPRSQEEIQNKMYRKLAGDENGLVANWNLGEGKGQVVQDSANEINGILGSTRTDDVNDPTWINTDLPQPLTR
ncbi:MAG: LamG domain-containing protein [Calditrichales bacterium]|nr:MAG: LamG domain-containing protein [Calditrichales bacterium]